MKKIFLNNREYYIKGEEGPCFIYGVDARDADELAHVCERVRAARPFMAVGIMSVDWNAEFSPWEAPAVFGNEPFTGGGQETLDTVKDDLLPYIRENYPQAGPFITAGYSLAGLWALWAFCECDAFAGCVSGSSSLWFPRWDEYIAGHAAHPGAKVYLSLGVKEEKTRNAVMARVGDNTRLTHKLLTDAGIDCTLEWNPGGHFADVAERMSRGMEWWLKH